MSIAAGAGYMFLSHIESRRWRKIAGAWKQTIDSLVDTWDVADDGHLFEWLDVSDWERVFEELERLPQGSRSLRRAIMAVAPDVLEAA